MSATVKIPGTLTRHTGGASELSATGGTVGAVIEDLESRYPGIKGGVCDDRGRLLRFVAVFVDGVDARAQQGMDTPVGPDSELDILQAIAGG